MMTNAEQVLESERLFRWRFKVVGLSLR